MKNDDEKPMKIEFEFAPGTLEALEAEMSPEELQAFFDDLKAKVEDGTFFTESEQVDLEALREENPEAYERLMADEEDKEVVQRTLN